MVRSAEMRDRRSIRPEIINNSNSSPRYVSKQSERASGTCATAGRVLPEMCMRHRWFALSNKHKNEL